MRDGGDKHRPDRGIEGACGGAGAMVNTPAFEERVGRGPPDPEIHVNVPGAFVDRREGVKAVRQVQVAGDACSTYEADEKKRHSDLATSSNLIHCGIVPLAASSRSVVRLLIRCLL